MDPRDLINKRMRKSDLMEEDATLIRDINKAIEEFQYEGFKKMGPGDIGSTVGSKGREGLAARFKGKNGGFDNSACMTAMKGKVSNPAAFCRSLEGYATGGYASTREDSEGCPTPGMKIRSKGKGRGLGVGRGKGPIGRMAD